MHTFLWIAILLFVIWIVVRFALALTGALLHLIWIIAIICLIVWVVRRVL
ncbi:MAG: lmo0937 family membrane protein [Chthoniobacterales bacterium]